MKIGIFTNNYLPNPFGVAGSIESFRKQFEKIGHEVYIFAPYVKGYDDENPNVYRYPSIDLKYKISFPLAVPCSRKISKIIDDLDLDIIHSQHHTLLGWTARKRAKKKNIPLVFTWHALYDHYVHFVPPFIPRKFAAWWINYQAVRYANSCDKVITPTDSVKEIITNLGVEKEKVISIPTGVEEKIFENVDGEKIRKKHNINKSDTVLLLVVRLAVEKNVEFLFRTLAPLLREKDNIKFLVVGGGHLLEDLKKYTKENNIASKVIFAGLKKRCEVADYYAASDIFVYSSKSETQGMIITEAMHMGLPVVAVRAMGVKNLVLDNETGFLTSEDEGEFRDKTRILIEEEEIWESFSRNAKNVSRENYIDRVTARKMLEVYESLIENR